jgi:DNA-directed RNA polymerase subunit RPC12/RpoP
MDTQIAYRPDAAVDPTSPSAKRSPATRPTMTRVHCGSCGARYEAPVDPKIVETIRGCAECGHRALVVIA